MLDHIVELLPISEDELCEPLRADYLKILRTLLEHPPLVEHLKPKQWQAYSDFALAVLSISVDDEENDIPSFASSRDLSASKSINPLSIRVSQSHGSRKGHSTSHASVEDLLACLRSLTATTNAPINSRALEILDAVLECLRTSTRSQDLALETFNNIALTLLGHNVRLLRDKFSSLVPIARRLWVSRSSVVKEQLLVTFSLCQGIIVATKRSPIALDSETKLQLLQSLQAEYFSRPTKDILSSDDVDIHFAVTDNAEIQHVLAPVATSARAESQWMLLRTVSQLHYSVEVNREADDPAADDITERQPKRQKTATAIEELFQQAVHMSSSSQTAALQVLLFLTDLPLVTQLEDIFDRYLSRIADTLTSNDSRGAFWALLLFSKLASLPPLSSKQELTSTWKRVWEVACRAISTTSLSRAACLAVTSIVKHPVLQHLCVFTSLQAALFGAGKLGPAILSDAAVWMFITLLQSNMLERDGTYESFSTKVLEWLASQWTLRSNTDRSHAALMAFHARSELMCALIACLKGVEVDLKYSVQCYETSDFIQMEARSLDAQKLAYLFSGSPAPSASVSSGQIRARPVHLNSKTRARLDFAVAKLLQDKLHDFADAWAVLSTLGRNSGISHDVLTIATTLCVVSYLSTGRITEELESSNATQELSTELWRCVQDSIKDKGPESQQRCATVAAVVLRVADASDNEDYFLAKHLAPCATSLLQIIKDTSAPSSDEDDDVDMLDSLDTGTSQTSNSAKSYAIPKFLRYELPDSSVSIQTSTSRVLNLAVLIAQGRSSGHLSIDASALVLDEILRLDAQSLISARRSVYHFLSQKPSFTREQVLQLLKLVGKTCLADSAFERCEGALSMCARVLTSLAYYWTPPKDDDLDNRAYDMYEWFITYGLEKAVLSPSTSRHLAHLLDAIAASNPSYGEEDLPSTRTSLFKILHDSSCLTKLRITDDLAKIFGRFVLSEHGAIFDDVVASLPSETDDFDGLGTRFYILSQLGSRWHSVLRHATYSLFETAAYATPLLDLQTCCIAQMCDELTLSSPKVLFEMFSPQILYTWLGPGLLDQIPYAVFSYPSLKAMVDANESEFVAQIALRNSELHINAVTGVVGKTWRTLLLRNFAQAEAYCLASQMTLPEKEQLSRQPEAAIRKELGSAQHAQLLQKEFPHIVAALFQRLQDDSGATRALEKAGMGRSKSALNTMSQDSGSPSSQFSVQQPSFRSKFIVEEVTWLSTRLGLDYNSTWSPALLVYLFRSLLATDHPALGPLHSSATVRKIRVAVAIGGINMYQGYPLEMLLHNMRPYLTVFQSSSEAISIYRYLLENSQEYLQTRLSYLAGVAVSVFASLTTFVSSSQESTTQESHFVATMTKAHEFRKWLAAYLGGLTPVAEDATKYERFKSIVDHAQAMNGDGSSSTSLPQGLVLRSLLEDQVSSSPLLQSIDFDLSISILCRSFSPAIIATEDILAAGEEAARLLPVLEKLMRSSTISTSFRAWLAQCIGRGISIKGPFTSSSCERATLSSSNEKAFDESASYRNIVEEWVRLLWESNQGIAASAEQCLQMVANQLDPGQVAALLGTQRHSSLLNALRFQAMVYPTLRTPTEPGDWTASLEHWHRDKHTDWPTDLLIAVCAQLQNDPILFALQHFAYREREASNVLLPYAIHVLLSTELNSAGKARQHISAIFTDLFADPAHHPARIVCLAIESVVYLRKCTIANESNILQRTTWLDINYADAAQAAVHCQMWHVALLFLEIRQAHNHLANSRTSRRSFQSIEQQSPEFVTEIYQHVDDPDFFYAGHEDTDVNSVLQRLNHESAGYKALSFQSAVFDAAGRSQTTAEDLSHYTLATAKALNAANLKGVSQAVKDLVGNGRAAYISASGDTGFTLLDWDMRVDDAEDATSIALKHLETLSSAADRHSIMSDLDHGLAKIAQNFGATSKLQQDRAAYLTGLAILAEAKDVLRTSNHTDFDQCLDNLSQINVWGQKQDFELVARFLNAREYILNSISRSPQLKASMNLTNPQALLGEARVVRQSLHLAQEHESHQFSLARATYFSHLSKTADEIGIRVKIAAQYDLARTLAAQDERAAAVNILQALRSHSDRENQDFPVPMSEILAELGQRVTQARLEPPDEVIENYLIPAYKDLGADTSSPKAGRIFHIFAAFCDGQLQDSESRDEYMRLCQIKDSKEAEIRELDRLMKESHGKNHDHYKNAHDKAVTWYRLDNEEWERVRKNRESLVLRCLEHYLLSLKASDQYLNDTLRVLTIWLEEYENSKATDAVGRHLKSVPSWKFAGLVNQLLSRLMNTNDPFQQCLMDLMFRICAEHPYHSLYQLFCASKTKATKADEVGKLRHEAAVKLATTIHQKSRSRDIWPSVHNLSMYFVKVAQAKLTDNQARTGSKLPLQDITHGDELIRQVEHTTKRVPPPTMRIAIRQDRDYRAVPVMAAFEPKVSIAGGISAPKIATVVASDGSRHKLLMKGGNDDLRQDSIMEQVFEQVSNLLQDHRATRERKLGIRTYKVVPLLTNAGIIEFVQDTIPLNDYLMPAHAKYFPKSYSQKRGRLEIDNVRKKPLQQRVQAYRTVTQNFPPVMRFFFMEYFQDPDDWFYKRLNYSRSTAAISMLGHVLGLGDRHGHNILLDTITGEVVHIDLGVAFEAGRVLPIPEVVPFRLTRDLVDGMGISGVEGVFRRCCNFTLEALRLEQESIMTILDVLRYDPLYSWSVSPLRMARMQENANRVAALEQETNTTDGVAAPVRRREIDESAEAARALAVVAKKLGKGLSVEATVNELIRQATDERNLAVLFCGWAAYA